MHVSTGFGEELPSDWRGIRTQIHPGALRVRHASRHPRRRTDSISADGVAWRAQVANPILMGVLVLRWLAGALKAGEDVVDDGTEVSAITPRPLLPSDIDRGEPRSGQNSG